MENQKRGAEDPLPEQWESLSRLSSPWFTDVAMLGLSERTPSNRLRRLLRGKSSKAALAAVTSVDAADLDQLEVVSRINAEQAEAAFRRTFVFNISVPITVAAAAMQAAPDLTQKIMGELNPGAASFYLVWGSVLGILATVYYAHTKARGARDLADLIALAQASRKRTAARTS